MIIIICIVVPLYRVYGESSWAVKTSLIIDASNENHTRLAVEARHFYRALNNTGATLYSA